MSECEAQMIVIPPFQMHLSEFKHRTARLELIVKFRCNYVEVKNVPVDRVRFIELCRKCSNWGKVLSCPPYSHSFIDISKQYKYLYTFLFSTDLEPVRDVIGRKVKDGRLNWFSIINADRTIAPMMNRYGRRVEPTLNGLFLKDSECRLCHPCMVEIKKPCKYPTMRRSSLEATGVNVDELSEKYLGHRLLWYRKGGEFPRYLTKVGGILTNDLISLIDPRLGVN